MFDKTRYSFNKKIILVLLIIILIESYALCVGNESFQSWKPVFYQKKFSNILLQIYFCKYDFCNIYYETFC